MEEVKTHQIGIPSIVYSKYFSSNGNQLDVFGRHDPFQGMNQIMRSFGGFGGMGMFNDDFFKDDFMMKPFGDPMDRMMNFSDSK